MTVERTITTDVEVEAVTPALAEELAEMRADTGYYDDVWDDLAADARHMSYGAKEVTS